MINSRFHSNHILHKLSLFITCLSNIDKLGHIGTIDVSYLSINNILPKNIGKFSSM